jgi:hypothetical protein
MMLKAVYFAVSKRQVATVFKDAGESPEDVQATVNMLVREFSLKRVHISSLADPEGPSFFGSWGTSVH